MFPAVRQAVSAAVIAARLAPAALGSDTGGFLSASQHHCGITGIKPTYGTVSRFGMVAYASSFDQAGPMAQTAEDCAILLNAMASFDERNSTSWSATKKTTPGDLDKPLKGFENRFALKNISAKARMPMFRRPCKGVIDLLKVKAQTVEVSYRKHHCRFLLIYVLASAEASITYPVLTAYVMATVRRNSAIWKKCIVTPVPKVSAARLKRRISDRYLMY